MSDMTGATATPPPTGDPSDFTPAGDARALKVRSATGAAMTLAAQGIKFVLQFGSQVALTRLLLPTDFGLIAMVAPLIAAALLLTDLGLSAATIQRPRRRRTKMPPDENSRRMELGLQPRRLILLRYAALAGTLPR